MKAGSLIVKIYLYTLVTVALVVVVILGLAALTVNERRKDLMLVSEHLVVDMAQRRNDPVVLQGDVDRLRKVWRTKVSLYEPGGRLIATTIDPPLPLPPPAALSGLAREDTIPLGEAWRFAHAVREDGVVVAIGIASHEAPASLWRALLPSLAVLLALFVALAILFTRHLVRPLRAVAAAAERFGAGDLTTRIRTQRGDEIGAVGRAFDAMADRISVLVTSQRELMANVSHELQTPLSRIRVAVELMGDGDTVRAEEMLQEITQDLEELEQLIDDVMMLARLDLSRAHPSLTGTGGHAGVPWLRGEPVALADVLDRACRRFRSLHDSHPLFADLGSDLPTIRADPALLRRAIDNLLDNARKYSPTGSRIELSARRGSADGRATIAIVDHGIGIEPADLERVFTPFFRGDPSRSRATGGVGLGLALARRVIEAHGGHLRLDSRAGRGTTVTMDLGAGLPP